MSSSLFGTDGIRARVSEKEGLLTFANVERIANIIGYLLRTSPHIFKVHIENPFGVLERRSTSIFGKGKVVIGMDTRESGIEIFEALKAGLEPFNIGTIFLGVIPTAAISYLTNKWGALLGVSISASHNPPEFNGIKILSSSGLKIPDKTEEIISEMFFSPDFKPHITYKRKTFKHIDCTQQQYKRYLEEYPADIISMFKKNILEGMKLCVDTAHGATSLYAKQILEALGAKVHTINCSPDGSKINVNCGSTSPEGLARETVKEKATLGVAYDGDGDRAIFVDETGHIRNGDDVLGLCGYYLKRDKKLLNNTVVATVMSNYGLEQFFKKNDIKIIRTPVGDKYVIEGMIESRVVLGGEQSGHIIFLDKACTGDGILTTVNLIYCMKELKTTMWQFCKQIEVFPQILRNIPVGTKTPFHLLPKVQEAIDKANDILKDKGRFLLRYSGTEPVVRVFVEGVDQSITNQVADILSEAIRVSLGQ